jgi:cytochrome c peroxidase
MCSRVFFRREATLRETARTAPYMHDGSLATLDEVVDFYNESSWKTHSLIRGCAR